MKPAANLNAYAHNMTRICLKAYFALQRFCLLLIAIIFTFTSTTAWAHQASTAYLAIQQNSQDQSLYQVNYELSLRDLMLLLPLDQNNDLTVTWAELQAQQAGFQKLVNTQMILNSSTGEACRVVRHENLWLNNHAGETYALQKSLYRCNDKLSQLDYRVLADVDDAHRVILTLKMGQNAAKNAHLAAVQSFPVAAGLHNLSTEQTSWWRYVYEGIHHLLIGWDHLLFLFSLVVAAVYMPTGARPIQLQPVQDKWQALKRTFWLATTFTVAHSITLCLAALDVVSLPSRFIESVIAFSIAIVALNNLKPMVWQGLLPITFAFGLVHGFGFANVIVDLPVSPLDKALALFLFNLGIELGQMLCIVIALPIAFYCRKTAIYKHLIFQGGSLVAVLFGLYWFIQRAFAL